MLRGDVTSYGFGVDLANDCIAPRRSFELFVGDLIGCLCRRVLGRRGQGVRMISYFHVAGNFPWDLAVICRFPNYGYINMLVLLKAATVHVLYINVLAVAYEGLEDAALAIDSQLFSETHSSQIPVSLGLGLQFMKESGSSQIRKTTPSIEAGIRSYLDPSRVLQGVSNTSVERGSRCLSGAFAADPVQPEHLPWEGFTPCRSCKGSGSHL